MNSIAKIIAGLNGHSPPEVSAELQKVGVETLPIPHGYKGPNGPRFKGWHKRTFGPEDFLPDDGIGVRNSSLQVLDRDCPEALHPAIMGRFTPSTLRSGRASTPEAHSWHCATGEVMHLEFRDVDGTMILELRSGRGHQTLIPPTINPEHNEPYVWHNPGVPPAEIDPEDLVRGARLEAAAALIARHYPPEGGQYHFGLYLAGFLIYHGMDEDPAYELMAAAYEAAGYYLDQGAEKNIRGVCRSTAQKEEDGEEYAGGPTLEEEYPEFPLKNLREFLGWRKEMNFNSRPKDTEGDEDDPEDDGDAPEDGAETRKRRKPKGNQADRLVQYTLKNEPELFKDQYGEPHACFSGDVIPLNSRFYPILRSYLWHYEKHAATAEALKSAAGTLAAIAWNTEDVRELHTRAAHRGDAVYYQLGRGRVIEVDRDGWRFVENPPILFRAVPNLKPLPDPVSGGTLDALNALVNLKEEHDRRMFYATMVVMMLPDIPRPIVQPTGVMGSGKTTACRAIKRTLDPTAPEAIRIDPRDFIQKAAHSYITMLDNQNSLPGWAVDIICRLVTGEGDSKRALYTDDEDVIYELKRVVLLNGINPPADRPDYQDRTLPLELERIPDSRRRSEAELWADFEREHAGILGVLFDALSHALAVKVTIRLETRPRLADWGDYAAAVYEAFGWGAERFTEDWALIVRAQHETAIQGSAVAQCIMRIMDEHDHFEKSASDLLEVLENEAESLKINVKRDKTWPSAPS